MKNKLPVRWDPKAKEILDDIPENYRSVSKWRYKIIYEVRDKYVFIADVFNTSQHPSKIKRDK